MKNKQEQQKQHANIGSNVHESHRHYEKQRNLDLKACILYESVYVKFRTNKTNICWWKSEQRLLLGEICLARKGIFILKSSPDHSAGFCKKSGLRRKYRVKSGTMPWLGSPAEAVNPALHLWSLKPRGGILGSYRPWVRTLALRCLVRCFVYSAAPLLAPEAGLTLTFSCSDPGSFKSHSTPDHRIYFPPTCPKYLALCYIELATFIFQAQEQEMGLLLPSIEQGCRNCTQRATKWIKADLGMWRQRSWIS